MGTPTDDPSSTTSTTAASTTTTQSPTTTETAPSNSPTMPGIVGSCDGFHKVSSGDQCNTIATKYGIFTFPCPLLLHNRNRVPFYKTWI
ncbi:hypothetical protein N7489_005191 [Penicillium chrysogenum]|uniref:LysM domain-containing protein n=1 Tax=Penicillium chrysogenum TaxID=5076 RepID=A0ABQ8WQS0_PENCH|nr:uncharacterized protein N7489_005191 [Penicillium chrysogenum]KAJ5245095.1 hypothetical protein N7489_005191 [Penicillium chrysogenum]KAJ5274806.1 hypothetical protein N7505_003351 [Penicillium chrysogenum]KAJ5285295.1 hypothetical protein N7524_000601 [Penicillium chrysogenum]KAJ6156527.1 hypothetical protein N7497_005412 [Penicillium chrysogenum]